ncbi:hypothetical protein NDU88_002042 [Pleurodeles waltl]|uniref:C2HC/C3H-type domain-containing protein n=2 Tax=Pleurodeles waltl TaxID=8319 RepID=A0AAV7MMP4_PLEWA|nr:hypothetical protein NDU88_002042 [Pleurodeles waltl]
MAPHPCPDTMPSYEKMAAAKFPSLGQEKHAASSPKHQSRLEVMRSQYHEQLLREKEMKMVNRYTQQQQSALNKARSYSYHHPHSAQLDPQPASGRQGFLSAGYSSRYNSDLNNETKASNWTAKKSSGVDRAYPLKPVFHKKAASLNNLTADEERRVQSLKPLLPAAQSNSRTSGKSPSTMTLTPMSDTAFSPGLLELQKRSRSNPGRAEHWHKLEAVGDNLEEEIRRKEAQLREKLRRTEEELRRIQREKQQTEQADKKREGRERKRWDQASRNTTTALLHQGNGFRNQVMEEDSSDDGEDYENSYLTRNNVYTQGDVPWINSTRTPAHRPSPLPGTHEGGVERLKKERLVASNSKIRGKELPPTSDRESWTPSYHSNNSSRNRAPPSGNVVYVSPSFREADHGSDYRHSASAAKPHTVPMSSLTPTGLNEEEDEGLLEVENNTELVPCHLCGRRFLAPRLAKHREACRKMQNSKRKVFDSSKARAKGTDLEPYLNRRSKTTPAQEQQIQAKKTTWRQKHETFIRNIRQAREVQQVIAKGGKLSDLPPPPPDENPDYVACPHCSRRFAPNVAERHIPKCETIKSKPRPPPQRRR